MTKKGRPPRSDSRKWRTVKMPLTDEEYRQIRALSGNQRMSALIIGISLKEVDK